MLFMNENATIPMRTVTLNRPFLFCFGFVPAVAVRCNVVPHTVGHSVHPWFLLHFPIYEGEYKRKNCQQPDYNLSPDK